MHDRRATGSKVVRFGRKNLSFDRKRFPVPRVNKWQLKF